MSFVNSLKTKNDVIYDIQDARLPQILAENKGKFLKVNDEGQLEFADVDNVIDVTSLGYSFTIAKLYEVTGDVVDPKVLKTAITTVPFFTIKYEPGHPEGKDYVVFVCGGSSANNTIARHEVEGTDNITKILSSLYIPNIPSDFSSKRYQLETASNGSLTWVEKVSSGGTKLYLHELNVILPGGTKRVIIKFISTDNKTITSTYASGSDIPNIIVNTYFDGKMYSVGSSYNGVSFITVLYEDGIALSGETYTDTVTEL